MQTSSAKPQVVIVGGGFAGLAAAQRLNKADVELTLIDRRNFHLFQPLLYQVATGELSPSNIASPLRGILRKQSNIKVMLDDVTGFDLGQQRVHLRSGEISFDYLVVAAGSTHHYFGNDHWRDRAPGLKTIEDATEIRRRVLGAFEAAEKAEDPEQVSSCLNFVIVGAGPTGCELAGALAEVAYHTMARDFRNIDPRDAKILLVEPSEHPLSHFPAPLPEKASEALGRLGVEIVSGFKIADVAEDSVTIESIDTGEQRRISTRTVLWAAGVKGSPLGQQLCESARINVGPHGRVPVDEQCTIPGHPRVFVCGDLAIYKDEEGKDLPCLAPVAGQMGTYAADCIIADRKAEWRPQFRYSDKGSMAVLGRYHAVGCIGKRKLSGITAWALWLFVHLMFITRFRNRVLVLVQWGWAFFTHDRSSRLITEAEDGNNRRD